jgi:response regulator RpfG family c-di-GMP phosphodiesterase
MNRRILCVDDEANVLEGLQRSLYEHFELDVALGAKQALELLEQNSYAVIVTDMRMPGMDGAALLRVVRERWPDTVRILLTGHADVQSAIAAVNDAQVLRFLSKPCPTDTLISALGDAVEHHRLQHAERELLNDTLAGATKLLVDVLALAAPEVFSQASRMRDCVLHMLQRLGQKDRWVYEMSALLSLLGCVALPRDIAERALGGEQLDVQERHLFDDHPETAYGVLVAIPRLEPVARIVRAQNIADATTLDDPVVRLGVQLLQVALALDKRLVLGEAPDVALRNLPRSKPPLRPDLLELLHDFEIRAPATTVRHLKLDQLRIGMVLAQDVTSKAGTTVLTEGRELTLLLLERMRKFAQRVGVVEPIRVRVSR